MAEEKRIQEFYHWYYEYFGDGICNGQSPKQRAVNYRYILSGIYTSDLDTTLCNLIPINRVKQQQALSIAMVKNVHELWWNCKGNWKHLWNVAWIYERHPTGYTSINVALV